MKRAWPVLSPDAARAQQFVWWSAMVVAAPLAVFCIWVFLQFPSRLAQLSPVAQVKVWHEDLGNQVFDQSSLETIVRRPPDWAQADWQAAKLPYFKELGASIVLPPDAPKKRVWLRFTMPEPSASDAGRQGLLGMRVQGGPWAVWVDGQLQQANLSDWRIQWNVPLRFAVPLGAREVFLAVPYAEAVGFSVGSILVGPMDRVETAWQERNLLHLELPRFMAAIAFLLMLISFQLAWSRPQEPNFRLLGFNALVWTMTSMQFAFDTTGQDSLAVWFASAVDSSVTWVVILAVIFALDYERVNAPRFKIFLALYAAASTVVTLPIWAWQKNALLAQQYINMLAFVAGLFVLGRHVWRHPRREGFVLFLALAVLLLLGVHTLFNLTNQTNPDSFYSFPLGTLVLYLTFTYVMGRRTVAALAASEQHEAVLHDRLIEQEQRLAEQHARLQALEVERRLDTQRDTIMQDLHDRLGSNLTSALLQARKGGLSPEETVLLLQDLADELRHIGASTAQEARSLNALLGELRQRVQNRLNHGGLYLIWEVDPKLEVELDATAAQHMLALLSEAIANVIKHADATQIKVEASRVGESVVISIADNGKGFDPETAELGRGLPGFLQRAKAIGAEVRLEKASPNGSRWRLLLPVRNKALG